MKELGQLLVVVGVLYMLSWGCHEATLAIGHTASGPVSNNLLVVLIETIFGIIGVLLFGLLALPYVLLHALVIHDTWFVIITVGGGLLLKLLGGGFHSASTEQAH